MAEYIKREAAKNILKRHEHRFTCADESNGYGTVKWSEYVIYSDTAQNCIDALPAADVVEVVRCRDCARKEICRTSNTWSVAPSDDWFCADGERKGGDE